MHRIYATSSLTIINKDGQDAGYGLRGLRGISAPRSIKKLLVPLAGAETIITKKPAYIPRNPSMFNYEKRMWTYQEEAFAKRRIVFKEGMVEWQCNCANWYEHRVRRPEVNGFEAAKGHGTHGVGQLKNMIPSLMGLSHLFKYFNGRALGFDEDVYNAFSGLQTYLNGIFPSGLMFGHPKLFFEISLCWHAADSPCGRRVSLRRRELSEAYTGDPVRNRLPSWSWMGWQGEIVFPMDQEQVKYSGPFCGGFTQAVTKWHALPTPNYTTKQPINAIWHIYREGPWKEQWEHESSMKQDCYYVLWIEWERDVAYRRGSGYVLADRWEELAEVDKVEVTLG
ncbi:heterokaryon incompatibility protein [Apiospora saccharicola]|uniref:Heterokaryon incompatibility protein n=1 Tax=Apiospora saccharicola TaxID=335842 RepID=A0ABR1UFV5_9PEZI